ncbi:phosphotransferase [Tumebacillus sp. ITR2]|uniref:Phosphotransferase n=1 Tax=Tumebacillus amylolyticus TaxID=2801339 RepID=A0ABS1J4N2_9BACL|nr:phosphotransferase [Tumebacillus amylolyticus]MBL0385239.1 phosphotransferase [Tumebacillus amylolyticus]
MTQPWSPEHVVTEALARQLIETQFPELAPACVQVLGEGFDNTVYQVNKEYVFRFPRREIAVQLLQAEGRLLPDLVGRFSLQIPEPLFYGKCSEEFPWPFLGYRLVHGLAPERVPHLRRIEAAQPLAEFLLAVHSFPLEKALACGIPTTDIMQRFDLTQRTPQLHDHLKKAADLDLLEPTTLQTLQAYADTLSQTTWQPPVYDTLVHADPHIRNLVVNLEGTLTGIIDWGDAHIGHRALDLSIVYSYLPPEGRDLFYKIYGEVDAQTREMARFRAVFSTLVLMLYGYDQQQPQLVATAKQSLHLALLH